MVAKGPQEPGRTSNAPSSKRRLSAQEATDAIRSMVLNLELAPGSIVSEAQLAAQLGFGRTPIREGLIVLAQERLITSVPGVGSKVMGLNIPDIAFISEFQEFVEPFAALLAAKRISDSQIGELRSVLDQARASEKNLTDMIGLDLVFHGTLCQATGNPYLCDCMMRLHHLGVRIARYAYERGVSVVKSWDEHESIVDAVARHDPDEAERLMREHTQHAWQRIRGAI